MRILLTAVALASATASAQTVRSFAHTDNAGSSIGRAWSPLPAEGLLAPAPRAGLLWTYVDAASITESVALGDGGGESWVAHALNDKRMSKFTTTGSGTPDFVYSLSMQNPGTIGVAAASAGSLCAVLSFPESGRVAVRAFTDATGDTPQWSYTFDAAYTNSGKRAVAVNADGTRVAVCAYDGASTLLVLLDGAGNVLDTATIAGYCSGVEMDDSGDLILVTAGATARLYDAGTMTEVYALATSGSGGYHRISRDGSAIACGGFNIRAARNTGGGWSQVYAAGGSNDWFGYGIALSGDGETLFVVSHDYGQSYLPNDHQVIDLVSGQVVSTWSYTGTGGFQNTVVGAQVNGDGTLFACASWGDQGNTQPEVRVFDRDLSMVGSIDSEGSPFEIDMSPDGRYVLVGSKAVHANTFGNGGRTYAYENESGCVGDWNGDGTVNTQDFIAYLNDWSAGNPDADLNGDGTVNTQDFLAFLNAWSVGC